MSTEEIKGSLLYGEDVEYEGILIRNYKLKEIFSKRNGLGLDKYNYLISLAILEVKDIIKDSKVDNIKDLKMYDIICTDFEFNKWFIEFLNTFTYIKWEFGQFNDFVAYDSDKKRIRLTEKKFDGFMEVFKKAYCVNRGSKKSTTSINPDLAVDEETKKFAEEILELQNQGNKKQKGNITLMGIIEGICSKPNSYDLFNIWNLTVYQLMIQYYGIEQNESYGYILSSVYAGIYDTKKNKLDIEKIHWACEIDI